MLQEGSRDILSGSFSRVYNEMYSKDVALTLEFRDGHIMESQLQEPQLSTKDYREQIVRKLRINSKSMVFIVGGENESRIVSTCISSIHTICADISYVSQLYRPNSWANLGIIV